MNISQITAALESLVGIRQRQNLQNLPLPNSLTSSVSGLFVDSAMGGLIFADAILNAISQDFAVPSDFLIQTRQDACNEVFCLVYDKLVNKQGFLNVTENQLIFDEVYTKVPNLTLNADLFYGLNIKFNYNQPAKIRISKLELAANQEFEIDLYVMNTKLYGYVQVIPITVKNYTANGQANYFIDVDIELNNIINGIWYVGFFSNDLPNGVRFLGNTIFANKRKSLPNATIKEVYVGAQNSSQFLEQLGQFQTGNLLNNLPIFNAVMSVENDIQSLVIANASYFANAIRLKWAIILIETISNSTRSNKDTFFNKDNAKQVIYGNEYTIQNGNTIKTTHISGLFAQYNDAINSVVTQLNALSKALEKTKVTLM